MKKIRIVMKNGVVQDVPYSYTVYNELVAKMGTDEKLEFKAFAINAADVSAVFFLAPEAAEEA